MEKIVTCQIKSDYIRGVPGGVISWYGHQFRIQEDRETATCGIPESVAVQEAAMGRYKIIGTLSPATETPKETKLSTGISDKAIVLGNYYGCGDLENFRKKIVAMDRNEIVKYAKDTMDVDLPPNSYTKKLVDSLCMIIETKVAEALIVKKPEPVAAKPQPAVPPVVTPTEAKTAEALVIK